MQKKEEDLFGTDHIGATARNIILNQLEQPLDGKGIRANSTQYVHILTVGHDELMIALVRQALMLCHFPNFHDEKEACRTRVTILSTQEHNLKSLNLGNVLDVCPWKLQNAQGEVISSGNLQGSFVDVEFCFVELEAIDYGTYLLNMQQDEDAITTLFTPADILEASVLAELKHQLYQVHVVDQNTASASTMVDVSMAQQVNMVYYASTYTTLIRPNDIDNVNQYILPLQTFIYHTPQRKVESEWKKVSDVALKWSNVYCADCFPYRLKSIGVTKDTPKKEIIEAVKYNLSDLTRTEHARWNMEKLLMGFRPLTPLELYYDEQLSVTESPLYRKALKKQHIHIDICSFRTLRRIDPDAIKYDAFMMLAMSEILKR